jgi:hypothetical protein
MHEVEHQQVNEGSQTRLVAAQMSNLQSPSTTENCDRTENATENCEEPLSRPSTTDSGDTCPGGRQPGPPGPPGPGPAPGPGPPAIGPGCPCNKTRSRIFRQTPSTCMAATSNQRSLCPVSAWPVNNVNYLAGWYFQWSFVQFQPVL